MPRHPSRASKRVVGAAGMAQGFFHLCRRGGWHLRTEQRLSYAWSPVLAELGALAKKQNVRLTRVQYTETPAEDSPDPDLVEIRMDMTLSGDYRPLMQFLNSVERDKTFFVIGAVTFTGQAGGGNNNNAPATSVVNLRLRVTTYLRMPLPSDSKQEASTKEVSTKQEAVHEVRR